MREEMAMMGLPRPGKTLIWVMGVLVAIWVFFAIGINYAGLGEDAFLIFAGNTDRILEGQIWRLLTAGLLHFPQGSAGVSHILYALLGLYFLAPSLEAQWGGRRMVLFLLASTLLGFTAQLAVEALPSVGAKLGQPYWFGSMGAVEAIAVAWALSNRGQTVRLFFVLPVTGTGLLVFIVGFSLFLLIAGGKPHEGIVTPFGGMLAGYLFGAGNPTPARRLLLRVRYFWIARRAARYRRSSQPRLRVIEGGESREARRKPPSDKRFLN